MNQPTDRPRLRGPQPLLRAAIAAAVVALPASQAYAINLPSRYGASVTVGPRNEGGSYFVDVTQERTAGYTDYRASSSLKHGLLEASVYTDLDPPCRLDGCSWGGYAMAQQWEIITFDATRVSDVTFSFTASGKFPPPSPGLKGAKGFFYFGPDIGRQSGYLTSLDGSETFSGTIQLQPGRTNLYYYQALEVSAFRGSSADFYGDNDTGRSLVAGAPRGTGFHWQIPEGVTWFSSSGEFMGEGMVSAPAPEPATWAMMILGFAGSGLVLRRRRLRLAA